MIRKTLPALLLIAAVGAGATAWAADPTLHEVYQAAESGHLDQAQAMMQQVLHDHPDSAKAHFVEAELLAREGRNADARGQLESAQRLDPQLAFAHPDALAKLRAQLGESGGAVRAMAPSAPSHSEGGMGWWPVLIGVLALVVIIRIVRGMAPPRPAMMPAGMNPGAAGYPGAPGYPPSGMPGYGAPAGTGPGMGSGILGGLATGAAMGAGVVAGEALMHHVLDGSGRPVPHGGGLISDANAGQLPDGNDDMGGNDFGVSDNGSWDSGGSSDLGSDDW